MQGEENRGILLWIRESHDVRVAGGSIAVLAIDAHEHGRGMWRVVAAAASPGDITIVELLPSGDIGTAFVVDAIACGGASSRRSARGLHVHGVLPARIRRKRNLRVIWRPDSLIHKRHPNPIAARCGFDFTSQSHRRAHSHIDAARGRAGIGISIGQAFAAIRR